MKRLIYKAEFSYMDDIFNNIDKEKIIQAIIANISDLGDPSKILTKLFKRIRINDDLSAQRRMKTLTFSVLYSCIDFNKFINNVISFLGIKNNNIPYLIKLFIVLNIPMWEI